MRRLILIAALATAGCTTPQGIRSNGAPFFTGRTARPARDVAACAALAWGATMGFHVRTEERGSAFAVILSGSSVAGSDMVADVNGSTVVMNVRPAAWGLLDDKLRDQLAACL